MFGLDPFSRPVAIVEIILLLALATFIGWLIARLIMNSRIRALRAEIAEKETALADCRRAKAKIPANSVTAAPVPPVVAANLTGRATVPMAEEVSVTPAPAVTTNITEPIPAPKPAPSLPPLGTASPTGSSEAAVLSRIASRASELNFDRIGHATIADADDLKDIIGIGPFLERKLHSLGIFTFRQVSNFTKEDISKVNEIIEFFPGRIERDNWVGQAKSFYEGRKE